MLQACSKTRVVDQNINTTKWLQIFDTLRLRANIEIQYYTLRPLSLDLTLKCLETLLTATCDDNLCVRVCKAQCCGATNTRCCSSNKYSFHNDSKVLFS